MTMPVPRQGDTLRLNWPSADYEIEVEITGIDVYLTPSARGGIDYFIRISPSLDMTMVPDVGVVDLEVTTVGGTTTPVFVPGSTGQDEPGYVQDSGVIWGDLIEEGIAGGIVNVAGTGPTESVQITATLITRFVGRYFNVGDVLSDDLGRFWSVFDARLITDRRYVEVRLSSGTYIAGGAT